MNAQKFYRLQTAFQQAAGLSEPERIVFVDEWSRQDEEIARELRVLLEHDEPEMDPLEAVCEAHRQAAATLLDDQADSLPTVIGYRVSHRIGRGGQAQVFLAHQDSTGQPVALKVFAGTRLTAAQRARIDAETESLARLQLPNVVPILDRGVTDSGQECLMTRYIDGVPLDQAAFRIRESGIDEVLNLFIRIADTLERVHGQGIIHRDLKPSNILVDREGEPCLLDFGLARFYADSCGRLLTQTSTMGFQGTLQWASPEQIDASFGDIDHRSDLYSLGVILYRGLTGRFPYPVDGGFLQAAEQIVSRHPAPLWETAPDQDTEQLRAIDAVVQRLLRKQKEQRFASAGALADALRNLIGNHQTRVSMNTGQPTGRRTWTLLISVGIVMAVSLVIWTQTRESEDATEPSSASPASHTAADHHPSDEPESDDPQPGGKESLVYEFDDALLPFGEVPPGWRQVGELQTDLHRIERADLRIKGDFSVRLTLSVDRQIDGEFNLTLVGFGSADDLIIEGEREGTGSDNETWYFKTPAGRGKPRGLPISAHTFILKRKGDLYTLSADAVYRPDRNEKVIATFAAGDMTQFRAIRVATTSPSLRLERVRFYSEQGGR